jgi:uncharacterized protein YggT (Ycf19 family)
MVDNKLEIEEAERTADYESVKTGVKSNVGAQIEAEASRPLVNQAADVEDVADRMRERAVNEYVETEREVERGRAAARVSQVVDYIFFVLYGLLAMRLILELFAARESAGFFQFIKTVTDPFYSPFRGLVPSPSTAEGFTLALPIIVAIIAYMLLHLAINGILRILAHRKTSI